MSEQIQPTAAQSKSSNIILIAIGIALIGLAIVFAWNKGYFAKSSGAAVLSQASPISNIVYLDVGGIISAATKKYIDGSKKSGQADPSVSGKEFSNHFAALLDEYKKNGAIVIDKRYVVSAPDGHDITDEVAVKLELVLDKQ